MKPGMIITSYKTAKESMPLESLYDNTLNSDILLKTEIEIKKANEEYDNIIKKANEEYQSIIEKATLLLNTVENLKNSIENNYIEQLKEQYILEGSTFLNEKDKEFDNLVNTVNENFNKFCLKAKNDIYEILLNTFESFFNEEYKNPENIKKLIYNNFDNFDSSTNFNLVLSKNLYKEFSNNLKIEIENDLNIKLNDVKQNRKLNGFILNTDLGSIECDLDKQIQSLKEQLNISI